VTVVACAGVSGQHVQLVLIGPLPTLQLLPLNKRWLKVANLFDESDLGAAVLIPASYVIIGLPSLQPFQHGFIVRHYPREFLVSHSLVQALLPRSALLLLGIEEVPCVPDHVSEFHMIFFIFGGQIVLDKIVGRHFKFGVVLRKYVFLV